MRSCTWVARCMAWRPGLGAQRHHNRLYGTGKPTTTCTLQATTVLSASRASAPPLPQPASRQRAGGTRRREPLSQVPDKGRVRGSSIKLGLEGFTHTHFDTATQPEVVPQDTSTVRVGPPGPALHACSFPHSGRYYSHHFGSWDYASHHPLLGLVLGIQLSPSWPLPESRVPPPQGADRHAAPRLRGPARPVLSLVSFARRSVL